MENIYPSCLLEQKISLGSKIRGGGDMYDNGSNYSN